MKIKFYHESFEYNVNFLALNNGLIVDSKRIVCPTCNGDGQHFRKDLDENHMIQSINEDYDEDSFNAYKRGAFDEVCIQCEGNKVIDEPIWENLPDWVEKCIKEWNEDERLNEEVRRAECGYQW